jgi:hypothetical protein
VGSIKRFKSFDFQMRSLSSMFVCTYFNNLVLVAQELESHT